MENKNQIFFRHVPSDTKIMGELTRHRKKLLKKRFYTKSFTKIITFELPVWWPQLFRLFKPLIDFPHEMASDIKASACFEENVSNKTVFVCIGY